LLGAAGTLHQHTISAQMHKKIEMACLLRQIAHADRKYQMRPATADDWLLL
jgi:hypothetical protein